MPSAEIGSSPSPDQALHQALTPCSAPSAHNEKTPWESDPSAEWVRVASEGDGVLRVRSRKFAGVRGVLSATKRFAEGNGCNAVACSRCESANLSDETEQELRHRSDASSFPFRSRIPLRVRPDYPIICAYENIRFDFSLVCDIVSHRMHVNRGLEIRGLRHGAYLCP